MDLSAFGDEHFDPKAWINNAFKTPEASANKEAFAGSLVTKLQLFIQEVNNSLEDTSQQVLQNLPRVIRDADAITQEAVLLKEQMRIVEEDIAKVERNTAQSMQNLLKIDAVKSRMQAASKALQEADNWTTLSANVDEVFASGDVNAISVKLVGMQQSLEILVDVPDYKERLQHLESLKDKLEAMISPLLVTAFNTQSTDLALLYVQIFSDIKRICEMRKYYHKCHKGQLLEHWKSVVEMDPEENIIERLSNYYDYLLSTWHNQLKWCSLVFTDISPVSMLTELFADVLQHLDPTVTFCIEAGLKQQPHDEHLQFLIDLKQISERFAKSLEVSIQTYGTSLLSAKSTNALAAAIFSPLTDFVQKYPSYEESLLKNSLNNVEWNSEDLIDSVRLLGESVSKIFLALTRANEHCMQFTNGCMYFALSKTFKVFFQSYTSRFTRVLEQLRKSQNEDGLGGVAGGDGKLKTLGGVSSTLSEDWMVFQNGLGIIQTCGEVLLQVDTLDQTLITCQLNSPAALGLTVENNAFQSYHKLLLNKSSQEQLRKTVENLQKDPGASLIPEVKTVVQKMSETIVAAVFELVLTQIQDHLAPLPIMKVWTDKNFTAVSDLPTFSVSPLEYITQIGQYLMTLPQHLEPFILQDNPPLKTALARTKLPYSLEQDLDQSDQVADYVLGCVAQGTLQIYVETILKINSVNPEAAKQLSTDMDYLNNVLDDLGLKASEAYQALASLLKASPEEYQTVAEGKPPRLVSAVRSMRGLRIM